MPTSDDFVAAALGAGLLSVGSTIVVDRPLTREEFAERFPQRSAARAELAREIARTEGRRYENVQRQIQRYSAGEGRQQRGIREASRVRMTERLSRADQARRIRDRGLRVSFKLDMDPSPKKGSKDRRGMRERSNTVLLRGQLVDRVAAGIARGDGDAAAASLQLGTIGTYMGSIDAGREVEVGEVRELSIDLA